MEAPKVWRGREGFSLVEIMVALTIMLIALGSLAGATAVVARMSNGSGDLVHRSGTTDDLANALSVMPWDQLQAGTSCETIAGEFPHERCVTVTDVSPREKRIFATVTPENPRVRPDTIALERGLALGPNPFNMN